MIWSGGRVSRRSVVKAAGFRPVGRLAACRRPHFSLPRQRKVRKRKASQGPRPYGLPCATRIARSQAQTRYAQTSARPNPVAAALLSTANGRLSPNTMCARSLRSHCTRWRALRALLRLHRSLIWANKPAPQRADLEPLSQTQRTKLGIQAPLHPSGGEGAGGKRGIYKKSHRETQTQKPNFAQLAKLPAPPKPALAKQSRRVARLRAGHGR